MPAEALIDYVDEDFPTCPSCDGIVHENAITCPCGAVVDEARFWVDPMPGASFEERMEFEAVLEREERGF